jgi:hypothetical protein
MQLVEGLLPKMPNSPVGLKHSCTHPKFPSSQVHLVPVMHPTKAYTAASSYRHCSPGKHQAIQLELQTAPLTACSKALKQTTRQSWQSKAANAALLRTPTDCQLLTAYLTANLLYDSKLTADGHKPHSHTKSTHNLCLQHPPAT